MCQNPNHTQWEGADFYQSLQNLKLTSALTLQLYEGDETQNHLDGHMTSWTKIAVCTVAIEQVRCI